MRIHKNLVRLAGLCAVVMLAACSGRGVVKSDLHIKGAPDWVNKGTAILKDKDGRLFHGVGSAPAMGEMSFQTSTADTRARAELARVLSSFMDVVSRDYMAAGRAGGGVATQMDVTQDIESLTRVELAGARIVGHWRDEKTNTIYSLAELDLDQVKKIVSGVEHMNSGLGRYLKKSGERVFDRLAEERP